MQRMPTRCVHAGTIRDTKEMGINSPIYTSTSFEFIDRDDTVYPRYLNTPNLKAVAGKIASLEGTETALVLSSGMAAITTVLFSFLGKDDHAVFQKGLYGGTSHFIEREFKKFGIGYSVAADRSAEAIGECIRNNTRLIYVETPSNPLLNITDLESVASLAKARGILTVIDNTFASSVNQTPVKFGIDIILHSATKYMAGHSDVVAGVVATNNSLMEGIRETGLNLGGSMNAMTLYLLERSLKTLYIRVKQMNRNALDLAQFLHHHSGISQVNYPGLPSHPDHRTAAKQMTGFGGMLSFELKDQEGIAFQRKLRLIRPSMSLGGLETICSSPAHTSHRHLGAKGRKEEGIPEELIRLSVGIEDVEDLKEDLDQALRN